MWLALWHLQSHVAEGFQSGQATGDVMDIPDVDDTPVLDDDDSPLREVEGPEGGGQVLDVSPQQSLYRALQKTARLANLPSNWRCCRPPPRDPLSVAAPHNEMQHLDSHSADSSMPPMHF